MRLIDADEAVKIIKRYDDRGLTLDEVARVTDGIAKEIEAMPTVDAAEVVRCEKCKHSRKMSYGLGVTLMCVVSNRNDKYCNDRQYNSFVVDKDHFCGYGERGDGD